MSEKELRELDIWIAEHAMEYKRGYPGGGKIEYWQPPPYKFGVIPVELLPQFTTDPADAMMVLEKCATKACVKIRRYNSEHWTVFKHTACEDSEENDFTSEAPTLPLAICLFAKQLFTPQPPKEINQP